MKNIAIFLIIGMAASLAGCSGKKVTLLENQVAEERARKASLQAETDLLQSSLTDLRLTNDSLRAELQRKEIVLEQLGQALDKLRDSEEEQAAAAVVPVSAAPPPEEAAPTTPEPGEYQAQYDRALGYYRQKNFAGAAEIFARLLGEDRNHSLADNCQFWLGECYYAQRQYETALAEYEKVFTFPRSNKIDAAQFKLALCFEQLKRYAEAREAYNRLIATYPASEYIDRARTHLEQLP